MSIYQSRFNAAWNAHMDRHGPVPQSRYHRIIRHIHAKVLQKMRQEEEHNIAQDWDRRNWRKGRETIQTRLNTWANNTLQAEAFKEENGGRTCHRKGHHPSDSPHPFLRRIHAANQLRRTPTRRSRRS